MISEPLEDLEEEDVVSEAIRAASALRDEVPEHTLRGYVHRMSWGVVDRGSIERERHSVQDVDLVQILKRR